MLEICQISTTFYQIYFLHHTVHTIRVIRYTLIRKPMGFGWAARKDFIMMMKGKPSAVVAGPQGSSATLPSQAGLLPSGEVSGDLCEEGGVVHRLATGFKLLLQNPQDASCRLLPPGISGTQVGPGKGAERMSSRGLQM